MKNDHSRETPALHRLLHPADWITLGFLAFMTVMALLSIPRNPAWWVYVLAHAAAVAIILVMIRKQRVSDSGLFRVIRYWYPVALVPIVFWEVGQLVQAVHPANFDTRLLGLDLAVFGEHPFVLLEPIVNPVLTDYMQLMYTSYYFLPLVPAIAAWRAGKTREFRVIAAVLVAAFFSSYVGYFVVPSTAPRLIPEVEERYPERPADMEGVVFTPLIRPIIDDLEPSPFDCFPSGHTEIGFVVIVLTFMFARRAFPWVLIAGGSLIFSTVYLRYHYVVDVAAGVAFGVGVLLAVPWFSKILEERFSGLWDPPPGGE